MEKFPPAKVPTQKGSQPNSAHLETFPPTKVEGVEKFPAFFKRRNFFFTLLCPPHWGVDILFLLFPASGIRHPDAWFRSFEGKVFILSLPNLVWVYWVNSLHGIAFGEYSSIAN